MKSTNKNTKKTLNTNSGKKSSKSSPKKNSSKKKNKPEKSTSTETSKDMKSSTRSSVRLSSSGSWKTRTTGTSLHLWADGTPPSPAMIWFRSMSTFPEWNQSRTRFIISVDKTDQFLRRAHWLLVWSEEGMKSFSVTIPWMSMSSAPWENMKRR